MITVQDAYRIVCCGKNSDRFTEPLLGARYVSHIGQLTQQLNFLISARKFGLETPVGNETKCGDLSVYVTRQDWLLQEQTLLPPLFLAQPAWQRIQHFVRWWAEGQGLAGHLREGIWMEFDVSAKLPPVPIPSFFFGIITEGKPAETVIAAVEAGIAAIKADLPVAQAALLKDVLAQLVPECHSLQIGMMLGRQVAPLRLCAFGLKLSEVPEFLGQFGIHTLKELPAEIWGGLSRYSRHLSAVDIDIGTILGSKVGLEMQPVAAASIREQQQDNGFQEYLQWLIQNHWCLEDKGAAILNWLGGVRVFGDWQDRMAGGTPVFRTISHVKLDFERNREPRAKAYLEYNVGCPESCC